ncbi:MAG: hypothetical protein NTV49_14515 [Kiritimatiellaeota bacterium]|nr:hypothetical protein [Kiritimatiellota bacterium]
MRKLIGILAGSLVWVTVALAGSPAQTTGTVATNGTAITVPASGSMAYRLETVVFGADTGTTQTVALVQGGITNQIATKAVSATDRMLSVTNAPWLFAGESVRITTTATNSFGVVLVGQLQN